MNTNKKQGSGEVVSDMSLRGTKQSPCLQAGDCFATLAMTIPRHLQFNHYQNKNNKNKTFVKIGVIRG